MQKLSTLKKNLIYAAWILLGVVLDQLTKLLAVRYLAPVGSYPLWKGVFHLTYVENRGAAFGMLAEHRWIFMIVSTVAILLIGAYLFSGRSYLSDKDEEGRYPPIPFFFGFSLATVISGGIGNMIDRIALGYVVDFLDFTLIDFAVFNVADCFVTVGAFMLAVPLLVSLIRSLVKDGQKKK